MDTMLTDGISRQKTEFPAKKTRPNGVIPVCVWIDGWMGGLMGQWMEG